MAKLFSAEYYKEAEVDEIRAELARIRTAPAQGTKKIVTGMNYKSGIEVTISNDGEAIIVTVKKDKRTAAVNLARVEYKGNYAKVNNADRALNRALQQAGSKLATYKF